MSFDDMQKAWQSQDTGSRLSINADLLLKEIRRNQQSFRAVIVRRDAVEVGTAAVMTAVFLGWAWRWHWWSLYLLAVACLFVGAFFVVDRRRQRTKEPVKNDPLRACIEASLYHVNHQIWLLRNIFWWYLLPPSIGLAAVTTQVVWSVRAGGLIAMMGTGGVLAITFGFTYWFVYWVNQRAVKKQLDPRRQELEELLSSLQ